MVVESEICKLACLRYRECNWVLATFADTVRVNVHGTCRERLAVKHLSISGRK